MIWKDLDISGYEVSINGEVRNKITGKVLKTHINNKGYIRVNLKKINYAIHRLLAIAFIPNPENKPIIDHINDIRTDNRVENLQWVSQSENIRKKKIPANSGITFNKSNTYTVRINSYNKVYCCGNYATYEEALIARRNAEITHYGDLKRFGE